MIEESEELPKLKANNSVYEDDEIDNENDFQIEDERAREEELLNDYSSRTFILPSCSKWFGFSDIHELEMQSLPEFFCGKYPQKTPEVYLS